eukprot:TRINITY_DN525_c0_g1_i6.p1 TRINITY_DN525_c0_g1~~TRINITY_DN525_c0_g1_i6.p1  ORF type:complete len:913 (+),score=264.18 TRINITY_DN525_c0_g1_i6:915-3653(+)
MVFRRLLGRPRRAAGDDVDEYQVSGGGAVVEDEAPRVTRRPSRRKQGARPEPATPPPPARPPAPRQPMHAHAINGHAMAATTWTSEVTVAPSSAAAGDTRAGPPPPDHGSAAGAHAHEARRHRHEQRHGRGHGHHHEHRHHEGGASTSHRSTPRRADSSGAEGSATSKRAPPSSPRTSPREASGRAESPRSGRRRAPNGDAPQRAPADAAAAHRPSPPPSPAAGKTHRRHHSKRHSRGDSMSTSLEGATASVDGEPPVWAPPTAAGLAAAENPVAAGRSGSPTAPAKKAETVFAPPKKKAGPLPSVPSRAPPSATPAMRYSLDERRPSTAGIVSTRKGGDGGFMPIPDMKRGWKKGAKAGSPAAGQERPGGHGGHGQGVWSGATGAATTGEMPRPSAPGPAPISAGEQARRQARRPSPAAAAGRLSLDGAGGAAAGGSTLDRAVQEVEASKNRRLSVDGDLPVAARTPHERSAKIASDGLEGVWLVEPAALVLPISLGACSKAGWEPVRDGHRREVVEVRKENQDAFCAHGPFSDNGGQIMVGVFDGHGAEGRGVSHFVRDTVPRAARELYSHTAPGRSGGRGDDTASLGPHPRGLLPLLPRGGAAGRGAARRPPPRPRQDAQGRLSPHRAGAHRRRVGRRPRVFRHYRRRCVDARGGPLLGVCGRLAGGHWAAAPPASSMTALDAASGAAGSERFLAVDTTWDQKPSRADERKRVKAAGGRVARWRRNVGPLRVWKPTEWLPGLAMTRSIGDTVLSPFGVQPVPEVSYLRLSRADSFLVLASDGVWEFMSSQEVATFVGRFRRSGGAADEAADALVREAVRRWRRNEVVVDDTTAVVVWIEWERDGTGLPAAVAASSNRPGVFGGGRSSAVAAAAAASGDFAITQAAERPLLVNEDGKLMSFPVKNDVVTE